MTADEYRALVKAWGLTPTKPSYAGATLHVDREGQIISIPDAESLDVKERRPMLDIIKDTLGINDH